MQEIYIHSLPNGMTLLAERMSHVRSAAFNFLLPAGCAHDPPECLGLSSILSEMVTRGAGERDNRALSEALDRLGVDRSVSVDSIHAQFSGVTLARNLHEALSIHADILRRPHLPEEELEPAQALALQEIQGLEDDPHSRVMVELARRHFPEPLGRDRRGTPEGLANVAIDLLQKQHARLFQPRDTIISVAGDIQWERLRDHVVNLFGDWQPVDLPELKVESGQLGSIHLPKELEQTQIALAYPSVPVSDPDYYNLRGALWVLSNDMSSRLFTNVREKHGLCYAVYAMHESFKDRASIFVYAGAKPELAQETLDRTLHELRVLKDGIEEEELDRAKVGLKAALIVRQESTLFRAGSLTNDWYYLGRVRPLEELQAKIDGLTTKCILDYAGRYPVKDVTLVTLGPASLTISTSAMGS